MLLSVFVGLVITGGAGWALSRSNGGNLIQQTRLLAWGIVGALLLYNYFALDLPGLSSLHELGGWAGLLTTVAGGLIGLLLGWAELHT